MFVSILNERQRTERSLMFTVHGETGHGSQYFGDTTGEKMSRLLTKMNEFRSEEMRKYTEQKLPYGNITTINLTVLKGGVQVNVIPAEMTATVDIRVSVNTDLNAFDQMVLSAALLLCNIFIFFNLFLNLILKS